MSQFDAHVLADSTWVVNVQSDYIRGHSTVFVVPLVSPDADASRIDRLKPAIFVEGNRMILATHLAGALPRRSLGQPRVSLANYEYEIKAALDMLISGF